MTFSKFSKLFFASYNFLVSVSEPFLHPTVDHWVNSAICRTSVKHNEINLTLQSVLSSKRVAKFCHKSRSPRYQERNQYSEEDFRDFDFFRIRLHGVLVQRGVCYVSKMSANFPKHFEIAESHNWVSQGHHNRIGTENYGLIVFVCALAYEAGEFTGMETKPTRQKWN